MHIFFSGIGGTGIGPLALVALQAGYDVSGSDKQDSLYIEYLRKHGINNIHIGQDQESIAATHLQNPIDWFVYSSAVAIEQPNSPEFQFCKEHSIRMSKRDELLTKILDDKQLKLIAIAGTHGKTTTTAMTLWLLKQQGVPVSHILPAKTSFADMGNYTPGSRYFVYEADEYDRNFLAYHPFMSIISGIDWDHPDIYPTRDEYYEAFRGFLAQSSQSVLWRTDLDRLQLSPHHTIQVLDEDDPGITAVQLPGLVNRQNAWAVMNAISTITLTPVESLMADMNKFPGVSRRFEQLVPGLYTDYAHTPAKIRGAIQIGHETAGDNLVVVYEGLHNTRQHFIRDELYHLFDGLKQLYIVPSYLAREDTSLALWSPADLKEMLSPDAQTHCTPSNLDESLKSAIRTHLAQGDTVLCLSAGGGHSLDEWLRSEFIH